MSKQFKSIAHRGFQEKDNSYISINKAFNKGFDMIELDIQLCKDDIIFYHDLFINNISIETLTYKEILDIDRQVINLDFFFKNFIYQIINIYFDLKGNVDLSNNFLNYIRSNNINTSNFYIASFNMNHLDLLKKNKHQHSFKIGFITCNTFKDDILDLIIDGLDFISIDIGYLNKNSITFLKKKNLEIFTYTLKDLAQYAEICNFDIDGIVTDILF